MYLGESSEKLTLASSKRESAPGIVSSLFNIFHQIQKHKGLFAALACGVGIGYQTEKWNVTKQIKEIQELAKKNEEINDKVIELNKAVDKKDEGDDTNERKVIQDKISKFKKNYGLNSNESRSPSLINTLKQLFLPMNSESAKNI